MKAQLRILPYFIGLFSLYCAASDSFPYSSKRFLDGIRRSQDSYYAATVRFYDSLLKKNPGAAVALEKCRFIESALYDAENEENPKQEDWENCYGELLKRYPGDIEVAIYKIDHQYGDSCIESAENLLATIKKGAIKAGCHQRARVYKSLALSYSYIDSVKKTMDACISALSYDDTADVRILLAQQYVELGMRERARKSILDGESRFNSWQKGLAGNLLLKLRYPKDAIRFYTASMADTSSYLDWSNVAAAYEQVNSPDSARMYYKKALENEYDSLESGTKLFEFDLRHSSATIAGESYRELSRQGWKADPLSFYRLRLFVKNPLLPVRAYELIGLLVLMLACLSLLVVPYLWILPLHYFGAWISRGKRSVESRFSLRHVWIVSSGILLAWLIASGFFDYQTLTAMFNNTVASDNAGDSGNAWFLVVFSALLAGLAIGLLVQLKVWILLKPRASAGYTLAALVVSLILLLIVRKVNFIFFPGLLTENAKDLGTGSAMLLVKSALLSIGFAPTLCIVCILVPFYEEFFFRCIGIEALKKYFPFWIANALQSIGFALLHDQVQLFPSFFVMGMALGYLYRKTQSLFMPILLHAANNAIATTLLWAVMKKHGL